MSHSGEDDLFEQVLEMVRPIVESNARRFRKQLELTPDEAVQEARIGLMLALRKYDYNHSRGGIYNFAALSVRRHMLKKLHRHRAQRRTAHVAVVEDGERRVIRMLPDSNQTGTEFVESCRGATVSPDRVRELSDELACAERFRGRLAGSLGPRERSVLACKTNPPMGLQMLMVDDGEEEPTIPMIGAFLGLTKNQTDWAVRAIKREAFRLIGKEEFSGMGESLIVRSYREAHT